MTARSGNPLETMTAFQVMHSNQITKICCVIRARAQLQHRNNEPPRHLRRPFIGARASVRLRARSARDGHAHSKQHRTG